ncbi:MAG: peptidoglycan-binding protein [Ruminococcaceae bacterium]|nr:peptidoglycan-binding protein [Oscillospiraceae bacterium]
MIEIIGEDIKKIRNLQTMLRKINLNKNILPEVIVDGIFDEQTETAVRNFQKSADLNPNGAVDIITFEKIVEEYSRIK